MVVRLFVSSTRCLCVSIWQNPCDILWFSFSVCHFPPVHAYCLKWLCSTGCCCWSQLRLSPVELQWPLETVPSTYNGGKTWGVVARNQARLRAFLNGTCTFRLQALMCTCGPTLAGTHIIKSAYQHVFGRSNKHKQTRPSATLQFTLIRGRAASSLIQYV